MYNFDVHYCFLLLQNPSVFFLFGLYSIFLNLFFFGSNRTFDFLARSQSISAMSADVTRPAMKRM